MIYATCQTCFKFVLFADDTNIFCSNENVEVLQDTLNRELAHPIVKFKLSCILSIM